MAKYIVPPKHEKIIKCKKCGTMYVPEHKTKYGNTFEDCPHCGYCCNRKAQIIPLWKYNLIKWFRGGFKDAAN